MALGTKFQKWLKLDPLDIWYMQQNMPLESDSDIEKPSSAHEHVNEECD